MFGARYGFGRPWVDSVRHRVFLRALRGIRFMGLAIGERAYGISKASGPNYAIVRCMRRFGYLLGIRDDGDSCARKPAVIALARHGRQGDLPNALNDRDRAGGRGEPDRLPHPRGDRRCRWT